MRIFIKTLGCEKNTIDSEFAAGLLVREGNSICEDPQDADVIVVNTCGFIEDAKRQSIETILEYAEEKKQGQRIVVTGCLAQRYAGELAKDLPEVDLLLGVNDYRRLPELLREKDAVRVTVSPEQENFEELGPRLRSDTPWTASIKIAEGCNNACTYCAIPMMRGKYRSRKPEDIIAEAKMLAASGCKELVVIAQDVTYYGKDLGRSDMLPELIRSLCRIDGIKWIRLMYCYEDEITQGLIDVMREEPKVCKYIDIPLQHASDRILKAMKRKSTLNSIESTIQVLRKQIPDITIRTTLISGFPGETKEDHKELEEFVRRNRFERLGVFAYSKEEGTPAAEMKPQVRKDVKERRRDRIMQIQREISLELNQKHIGDLLQVLVEEDCGDGSFIGRSRFDAPEIDDSVIFTSERKLKPGDMTFVRIEDAFDYDLTGREELPEGEI